MEEDAFQLEIDHEQLAHDYQMTVAENLQNAQVIQELRQHIENIAAEKSELQSRFRQIGDELASVQGQHSQMVREKVTLVEALKAKNTVIKQLEDDLNQSKADIISTTETTASTTGQDVSAYVAELTNLKFENGKLQQELTLQKNHSDWLSSELDEKNKQVGAVNRKYTVQIDKMRADLDARSEEVEMERQKFQSLESKFAELSASYAKQSTQLTTMQSEHQVGLEALQTEMNSLRQYNARLKSDNESVNKRLESLQTDLNALESGVENRRSEWLSKMETLHDDVTREHDLRIQVSDELVAIKDQLASSHQILKRFGLGPDGQVLNELAPSMLSENVHGMNKASFTEVFSKLHSTQLSLRQSQKENAHLKQNMQDILNDVQAKSSYFAELEQAYSLASDQIQRLEFSLEDKEGDLANASSDRKQLQVEIARLDEELVWTKRMNQDLGIQVREALLEIMELRGEIPTSPDLDSEHEEGVQALISERLITIRSLEELQLKNQELLSVVRKLSDVAEQVEKKDHESKDISEIQSSLEDLKSKYRHSLKEVETLRAAKSKLELTLRSTMDETDMYRRIADNSSGSNLIPRSATPVNARVLENGNDDSSLVQHYRDRYEDLDRQFEAFRKETATDHSTLTTQLNSTTKELSSCKIHESQLETQLQLNRERIDNLSASLDRINKDNGQLRERRSKLLSQISTLETSLHEREESKREAFAELERQKIQVGHLTTTVQLLREAESRHIDERTSLIRERDQLNELFRNVRSLQGEVERAELETKRNLESAKVRLENEVDSLKKELENARSQLRFEASKKDADISELQAKLEQSKVELDRAKENAMNIREQSELSKAEVSKLEQLLKVKEEVLASLRDRVSNHSVQSVSVDDNVRLEGHNLGELAKLQEEIDSLKQEIDIHRQHSDTYREIAQTAEQKLTDHQEAYELYRQSMDSKVQQLSSERDSLNTRLEDETAKIEATKEQYSSTIDELNREVNDLRIALEQALSQNTQLSQEEVLARNNSEIAVQDMKRQLQIAEEASNNYQSELIKHAKSMETITRLKEELSRLTSERDHMKNVIDNSGTEVLQERQSWSEHKTILESQVNEMSERVKDISKQNQLLHSQLEEMSEQMNRIRRPLIDDELASLISGDVPAATTGNQKAIDELREIVKYLKRDKDTIQYEYDATVQTSRRLQIQLDQMTRQLEQARLDLSEERDRYRNGHVLSSSDFAEYCTIKDQVSLLRESNKTLRSDYEVESQRAKDFDFQANELRKKLEPLDSEVKRLKAQANVQADTLISLTSDNEHWKARTQEILAKYDKIDPTEHNRIVEEHAKLRGEINDLKQSLSEKELGLKASEEKVTRFQLLSQQWKLKAEQYEGFMKGMSERLNKTSASSDDKTRTLEAEKLELDQQIKKLELEIEEQHHNFETERQDFTAHIDNITKSSQRFKDEFQKSKDELARLKEQYDSQIHDSQTESGVKPEELEQKLEKERETTRKEVEMRYKLKETMSEKKIKRLENEIAELKERFPGVEAAMPVPEVININKRDLEHDIPADAAETSVSPIPKKMRPEYDFPAQIEERELYDENESDAVAVFSDEEGEYTDIEVDNHDESDYEPGQSVQSETSSDGEIEVEEIANDSPADFGQEVSPVVILEEGETTDHAEDFKEPTPVQMKTKDSAGNVIITSSGTVIRKITFDAPPVAPPPPTQTAVRGAPRGRAATRGSTRARGTKRGSRGRGQQ